MARGSLRHEDAQQIGQYIKEGTWEAISVRAIVQQYKSGEKETTFKIVAKPLTSTFEEVPDGEEKLLNVQLGKLNEVHPGHIDPKSFYDPNVDPEDLGDEVGTEGNSVFKIKPLSTKWARFEESLRKCGVPPEISDLGVPALFDGLKFHCTTVATGGMYVVREGEEKGQSKPYTQVLIDRIQKPFPWEKQDAKPVAKATTGKPAVAKATTTAPAANGNGSGDVDWLKYDFSGVEDPPKFVASHILRNLKPKFWELVTRGEPVSFAKYAKAMEREVLRHKVPLTLQKPIHAHLEVADNLIEFAPDMADHPNAFQTDGETIEFVS